LAHVYLLEEMIRTWIRQTTSEIVNIDKDEEAYVQQKVFSMLAHSA